MRLARSFLGLALLAPVLSSQGTVWIVDDTPGPGVAFASIRTAIQSSSVVDGDVLLVKPGTYPTFFLVGKSLTILAEVPGTVQVPGRSSVSGLVAGKNASLRGLSLGGLTVTNCASTVWIEECSIVSLEYGESGADAALQVTSANLVLLDDVVTVNTAFGCFSTGGFTLRAEHAMYVDGTSRIDAFGSRFQGGQGIQTSDFVGHPCIPTSPGSGVWSASPANHMFFSDCEIVGGISPGCGEDITGCYCFYGGTGLQVTSGDVAVLDSVLTGGDPFTYIFNCGPVGQGLGFSGTPQFLAGAALSASTVSPVHEGGAYSFHLEGPPSVPVFVRFAGFPDPHASSDPFRGSELLPLAPSSDRAFFGFTDAVGVLDRTVPQGPLPIGWQFAPTFVQFFYLEAPSLPGQRHALRFPAVPQSYVLGAGSHVIVLDESF